MQPETRYARNGSVSLAYQTLGAGERHFVLPLSFLAHLELNWEEPTHARIFRRLAALGRLTIFNQRGFGVSDHVSEAPTLEERAADVEAVMDAVGCERAILIGMSDASPVTILFAATRPERVENLLLYSAYASRARRPPDYPWGDDPAEADNLLGFLEEHWGSGLIGSITFPSVADEQERRSYWGRVERAIGTPHAVRRLWAATAEVDVRGVLPAIKVPTVVAHRQDNRVFPFEGGRYIANHIPGAIFIELEGEDHAASVAGEQLVAVIEEHVLGSATSPDPNRVFATVMFTDIVESTARAAEVGDRRWHELLEAHDHAVRREIGRAGGQEVRHTGDGFFAAFDGPVRAIRCACAASHAVAELGLEMRAGVHSGECELIGGRLGGLAIHFAARVAACANPGEVLASEAAAALAAGSGIAFGESRLQTLKGLRGEWALSPVSTAVGEQRPRSVRVKDP